MNPLPASLLLFALVAAGPVTAQTIYRWVDAKGVTHYTDNLQSVPAGLKATTTDGEEISTVGTPPPVAVSKAPTPAAAPPVPSAAPDDAERRWRSDFRAAKERVRSLEDEIAVDQRKVNDPSRMPMTGTWQCGGWPSLQPSRGSLGVTGQARVPGGAVTVTGQTQYVAPATPVTAGWGGPCWYAMNGEYQQAKDRLERNQLALKRAQDDLADLERRAANEAVPFDWRR